LKSRSALRIRKGQLQPLAIAFAAIVAAFLTVLPPSTATAAASKYSAIVIDAVSGKTLYAQSADAQRHPASLTKMMTLYILFEELDAGRMKLTTPLNVSASAAAQAPSKLGLKAGTTIKVEDAILGIVTKSANDAAWVVGENIGGSVPAFAQRMNKTARALGMNSTVFYNPNGLPDSRQVTTARDFARLGLALQDRFPSYYKYFGTRTFTYHGRRIRNHNHLLGSVKGVDGIKTGYIRDSGFNIVTNVRRDGRHIITVVMGGKTAKRRDAQVRELIADYLPDAKRGKRTPDEVIVADAASTAADAAAVIAAADSRVPRSRPAGEADDSTALAYAADDGPQAVAAADDADPEDAPDSDVADAEGDVSDDTLDVPASDPIALRIKTASAVAEFADITMQADGPDPIARLTQIARLRIGADEVIAGAPTKTGSIRTTPATATVPSDDHPGWHIQLGAVPTADGARELLNKAKASMGTELASLYPVTQEVDSDGTTLYRARFAGFSDKDEARDACQKLKRKSFSCLAVPN
jgi:D-alanyl-D-alanine carboxypeptidase